MTRTPSLSSDQPLSREQLVKVWGEPAVSHSERFRKVSNRYPHQVAMAYRGDIVRAATDSDAQVAANVAAYEQEQEGRVWDWVAVGAAEREDDATMSRG